LTKITIQALPISPQSGKNYKSSLNFFVYCGERTRGIRQSSQAKKAEDNIAIFAKSQYSTSRRPPMTEDLNNTTYYGRRSQKEGYYDWMVRIDSDGCFVTDPIEDWEKDNDYRDEAISNPALYEVLTASKALSVLQTWKRTLR
jgi:hypothetical protein